MTAAQSILIDAARRAPEVAHLVMSDLSPETAHDHPEGHPNSIAWLVWHAARQQDSQVAHLADSEQVWVTGDWAHRTGVDRGADDFGFGDSGEQAQALHVSDLTALEEYFRATVAATVAYVESLADEALEEVIDTSWDPPVTRGTRLVSTIDDAAQHVGQAAYARAIVEPTWKAPY